MSNCESFFERSIDFSDDSVKQQCFRFYDKDSKGYLAQKDFEKLVLSLLKSDAMEAKDSNDFFTAFDANSDGKIDAAEFENAWNKWIKVLLKPVSALIVIDVQNDFIDGALPMKSCPSKQDAAEIIPVINELLDDVKFDVVAYSFDYHNEDHISFFENLSHYKLSDDMEKKKEDIVMFDTVTFEGPPKMVQRLWPKHCIMDTVGAQLHPDLKVSEDAIFIYKGTDSKVDSYSAFWDNMQLAQTELDDELKKRRVTHVFLSGIALDYCVAHTALDALRLGYATTILKDATRGINIGNIEYMMKKVKSNFGVLSNVQDADNLVSGRDVRIEFARVLAKFERMN